MATRRHIHEEYFPVAREKLFGLLHRPSAIRQWWGAARAIVIPGQGGIWAAVWVTDEDHPDYITAATIQVFEPPGRLVLADYRYVAKSGPLPFQADFETEFAVRSQDQGAILRVTQEGFPCDSSANDFLAACEVGWRNTFAGIRRYLQALDKASVKVL
jgi:uncharacterized protein YndB with AHSA1/START domain